MLQLPQGILFDLDETILTEGDRLTILLDVAEQMEEFLTPNTPVELAAALDAALRDFWSSSPQARAERLGARFSIKSARESVISDALRELSASGMPEVGIEFCERFTQARASATRLFDGAADTLKELRRVGVRLGLVTNGAADIQREKLERFELSTLFDHVQIEGEIGFGKPEEMAYRHAMKSLGTEPANTWMVGDNLEWEVAAPQRLGIHAIWHDPSGKGLPAACRIRPDRIIGRLSELLYPVETDAL
ncbi:hypothetical protein H009_20861 [Agrobacterium tumefaciens str. Cherry 2E-2-2]|nr:hypothetical protein H009_20861 [Agrobacterium tumefaciens str. Cherry 2E-2-2]